MIRRVLPALLPVVALLVAAPACADDMPTRKAGLWEVSMGFGGAGRGGPTMQQCTDATTDQALHSSAGAATQQDCSKREVKRTAGGMTIDMVCTRAGKTISSHVDITGSFDSSYVMKITTDTGAPRPSGETGPLTVTMEAKWVGPCKADMRPGDMIMPGGMKINVQDLQRMRGAAPGAPGGMPGVPGAR